MNEEIIYREPTKLELDEGLIDITKENPDKVFFKKLSEIEHQFCVEFKPFCSKCAINDFETAKKQAELEAQKRMQKTTKGFLTSNPKFTDIKIKLKDLKEYGDPKHFELVKELRVYEQDPTSKGRRLDTGLHRDFVCKQYGYGITIFVPNEKIETLQKTGSGLKEIARRNN